MGFTASATSEEVITGIDLAGKTAVITGASGGLGAETARALASKGATVLLIARDQSKLGQQVEAIKASTGNDNVSFTLMDLSDLDSVRQAAATVIEKFPVINILVNNAGVMACPLSRTEQGFESQFGVNHLGHFLFTRLLIPSLKAGAPARVVSLSSGGHKMGDVDLDDPNWEQREYDKWQAYGAAKTANALFAVGLNDRYPEITANAIHPGVIMTDLARHLVEEDFAFMSMEGLTLKSVEQGAATSVWAATSPDLEGKGGLYLEDAHIGEEVSPDVRSGGYLPYALDKESADKLWALSEQLIATQLP
jgi:NAD(P)-dependent dehydrogenase (short-subunit alcohol dehydrogenase family)